MWLVRRSFVSRRPRPRIQMRFMRGPSSAMARFTYRFSSVMLKLFSAFATAERTTRPIGSAAPSGRFSSIEIASSADFPVMRSVTSLALRARIAGTSRTRALPSSCPRLHGRGRLGGGAATMRAERPRRRELAQAVTDHVLRDEDRHVTATVVHGDRVADHRREHERCARPGLDHLLLVARVELLDLLLERVVDERALPDRAGHLLFLFFGRSVTKRSVFGLRRVLRPIAGLPHGVCAWPPTGDFASPPPCGWSDRKSVV